MVWVLLVEVQVQLQLMYKDNYIITRHKVTISKIANTEGL